MLFTGPKPCSIRKGTWQCYLQAGSPPAPGRASGQNAPELHKKSHLQRDVSEPLNRRRHDVDNLHESGDGWTDFPASCDIQVKKGKGSGFI